MDLQAIQFDTLDANALDRLKRAEDNLRFDGDHDPLLNLRGLIADLNSIGVWPGRDVLATPERGLVSEGLDLKVNLTGFTYVSCFIDSMEELAGEQDWSWRSIAQAVTDRLNEEIQTAREALIAPAYT